MRKTLLEKGLVIGIIILFIGTSVLPNISGNILSKNEKIQIYNSNTGASSSLDNSTYDLLIITPSDFQKSLEPLKEHKNKCGVKTNIITLDQIYNDISYGRDNPEKIKLFIKKAFDDAQIKYVLLVGNFRKIPIRYVNNADINFNEPYFISELYYADIVDKNGNFSSWDTNNNGIYGEWNNDEAQDKDIDLYPDVCVGRLACRNIIEVKIMVNKIINYETSTYGKEWFNRIVGIGGDTYPPGSYPFPTPAFEGEENIKTCISYMTGFENTKLFTSDGTLTGPDDVIREVNKGCGFLVFNGHGNPARWSTHPPNNASIWIDGFSLKTMSKLTNDEMLPICVVGACHNLEFDVNIFKIFKDPFGYMTWVPECWGWKLTRKIGGGSIATIGYSALEMAKEDKDSREGAEDFLDPSFFYNYGINKIDILGEVWRQSISGYLDKYPIDWNTPAAWDYSIDAKTVQQWVLLGDPSLKIGGYPS
jgi:hypothetical protein